MTTLARSPVPVSAGCRSRDGRDALAVTDPYTDTEKWAMKWVGLRSKRMFSGPLWAQ
ncbi:hypothetical protein IRT45_07245 [Nocardia sp. BSTN01]|nr:hypothetical protein [Nocardia sp. BSTN01]